MAPGAARRTGAGDLRGSGRRAFFRTRLGRPFGPASRRASSAAGASPRGHGPGAMSPDLPAALRVALDRALDGVPRKGLAERAARTSEAYRAGRPSAGVIREPDDALAYALTRLPATYAACATVFAEA